MTDEDDVKYSYDNLRTQGWLEGHAGGLDAAAEFLRERAVKWFREGMDDEAARLRRLSEDMVLQLRTLMDAKSKRHAKEFLIIIIESAP